jgi:putative transposase
MKTVAEVIGVSRSNLVERRKERPKKRIGRRPLPDDDLVARRDADLRIPAGACRPQRLKPPNHKRVYRVMQLHSLLLDRHAGGIERRHDGRIAVDEPTGDGAPTASRSAATTATRSASPSRSITATVRP